LRDLGIKKFDFELRILDFGFMFTAERRVRREVCFFHLPLRRARLAPLLARMAGVEPANENHLLLRGNGVTNLIANRLIN
jgi:hypothetical protein